MNQQRSREIQVGVMVVIGIVIFIAGIMFFKRVSLDTDMVRYSVDFSAVEGLRKGDRVQLRGIRVGAVEGFEVLPGKVRVHVEIEEWVRLYDNAKVVLVLKGLVGEVLVDIEPGDGTLVQPGHVFEGRNAASMLALGDKVNAALDQVTELGEDMRGLIDEVRGEGLITDVLATAERTMLELEGTVAENRSALRELTTNLADLTGSLDEALGEGQLDTTLVAARDAAESLTATMAALDETNARLAGLLDRLETGEGTAAMLLNDPSLYVQADSTLQSLQRLTDQLRRNPKAMLKMSLF
jgi:phospholipid/cholesterol/gamma-HCH transport system substrate-binding protein